MRRKGERRTAVEEPTLRHSAGTRYRMAKNSRFSAERGRVKLRILDLEVDGVEDTLAETVKSAVAAALTRNGSGREQAKALRHESATIALPSSSGEADTIDHEEVGSPSPRRVSQNRRLRKMNVLPLDFSKAAKSITEFIDELNLDGTMKKFTAVAVWYKEYMDISVVSVDHIFTAYKKLGWNDFPKDPIATFKDLKNKRQYKWFGQSERGEYEVNHVGEQQIAECRKA